VVKEEIDKEGEAVEIVVDLVDLLKPIQHVSAPSKPVDKVKNSKDKLRNSNDAFASRLIKQQSSSKLVNAFPQKDSLIPVTNTMVKPVVRKDRKEVTTTGVKGVNSKEATPPTIGVNRKEATLPTIGVNRKEATPPTIGVNRKEATSTGVNQDANN